MSLLLKWSAARARRRLWKHLLWIRRNRVVFTFNKI